MTATDLKTGDAATVLSNRTRGRVVEIATVLYASPYCYQLSNGLLYEKVSGACVQGPFGGYMIPAQERHWAAFGSDLPQS